MYIVQQEKQNVLYDKKSLIIIKFCKFQRVSTIDSSRSQLLFFCLCSEIPFQLQIYSFLLPNFF